MDGWSGRELVCRFREAVEDVAELRAQHRAAKRERTREVLGKELSAAIIWAQQLQDELRGRVR